jgi:hypothetical protein
MSKNLSTLFAKGKENLPRSDPLERYHISNSRKSPLDITKWLAENKGDQATEVHLFLFDNFEAR